MRRSAEWGIRAVLVAGSVLSSLVLLELGCRMWRGSYWLTHWPNLARAALVDDASAERDCSYVYDPVLGWAPRPGFRSRDYNVDAEGFRRMPAPRFAGPAEPALLAIGDSFAEGDEVADGETWPAYLQGLAGRRVINAGVSGYGFDQMVLRSERVAAALHPAAIVMSFVASDIGRGEYVRLWGRDKPFFELRNGRLELRGSPVRPSQIVCGTLPTWPRLLGWSMLVATVTDRVGWLREWYLDDTRAQPAGAGDQLVCPLMRRLADLSLPMLVVAQFDRETWRHGAAHTAIEHRRSMTVLHCAEEAGLATLDLFGVLQGAVQRHGVEALYRSNGHHTPDGNRIVAAAIAAELDRRRLFP